MKDNFLSNEELIYLASVGLSLDIKDKNKHYYSNNNAYSITNRSDSGDITRIAMLMGKKIIPIIEKARSFVTTFIDEVPPIETTWFCYAKPGYVVPEHADVVIKASSTFQNNYKVFIFCHDYWDSTWGGQLGFISNGQLYDPKPNRAILYTPNEKHYVNTITKEAIKTRMFFGMRWGKEGYAY